MKSPEILDDLTNATIMMVDDELITMEVVKTFLEEVGYSKFVLVEDGREAVAKMQEHHPEVLFLDLKMPEISGFEILETIRQDEEFNHLPIIILTSSADHENKLKALELGATDFLAKPVDSSELALRLKNTLSAKAYQDQLAYTDPVTGLPNRHLFLDRMKWAIAKADRYGEHVALVHICIDKFDRLNATLGVVGGDILLKLFAQRIGEQIRTVDMLGYIGSDEESGSVLSLYRVEGGGFSLLVERIGDNEDAGVVSRRLLDSFKAPFLINGKEIYLTCSIGIANFPSDSRESTVLIQAANSAKNHAVQLGGNSFQFYSSQINERYVRRMNMESRLHRALEQKEFVLYYQPQVGVHDKSIKGVEALIRWIDKDEGVISPGEFIPVLEESGLIVSVGEWVLQEACQALQRWADLGKKPITMSVNVSAKQFEDSQFFNKVRAVVASGGFDPANLIIEVTESLFGTNFEKTVSDLSNIKKLGPKVSIDDFGTGYSSFSKLNHLPVDELKIDRSFIINLPDDSGNQAIVSSLLFLAGQLGLKTVIEGIEAEDQLAFVAQHAGDLFQGFLFSKPLPEEELLQILP